MVSNQLAGHHILTCAILDGVNALNDFAKIRDRLKFFVNAGEADVGHHVELPELSHDVFADLAGGDLVVSDLDQRFLYSFRGGADGFQRDRALSACDQHAIQHLLPTELLPRSTALDDV